MDAPLCGDCPLVRELEAELERLRRELDSVREENALLRCDKADLRRRVNMNSTNSSKPPSTDGLRKRAAPGNLREPTDRRPGAQPGHRGSNVTLPHGPDEVVVHTPDKCKGCPRFRECSSGGAFEHRESRYVLEAVVGTRVVEHRLVEAVCPGGERDRGRDRGSFPDDVRATIQYGDSFACFVSLMDSYGFMSDSRISEVARDLFGVTLSPGTVVSMVTGCADRAKPVSDAIRQAVVESPVVNFDETGCRCGGRTMWVHNSSTPLLTHQTIHVKRGSEGMDWNGVLPEFEGYAVHDFLQTYFKYDAPTHAMCGAHLLRELKGNMEAHPEHRWASRMFDLMMFARDVKASAQSAGLGSLDPKVLEHISGRYDAILALAEAESPPPPPTPHKRGRRAKGRERALIERFIDNKESICRFLQHFEVPFTNNQAERDVRFVKTKMKISGCFRDIEHAQRFLDLSSYLGTCRKHGTSAFEALRMLFDEDAGTIIQKVVRDRPAPGLLGRGPKCGLSIKSGF